MPTTTITFNGLLVFHYEKNKKVFEVGVLRARAQPHAHILQILVKKNGDDPQPVRFDLEAIVQAGFVKWDLDVLLNDNPVTGLDFKADEPADRLDPQPQDDFGWILNIEKLHGHELKRTPNRLQPVIFLRKGRLFTSCKTDSVDTIQDGEPGKTKQFGFIAGAITLAIDTSKGEQTVLRFDDGSKKTEIFRLDNTDTTDYSVSIMNTPEMSGMGGGHFHLFYDRLFQQVPTPERFDLGLDDSGSSPSDRCPEESDPLPDPFKCGGISVGDGSGPLG